MLSKNNEIPNVMEIPAVGIDLFLRVGQAGIWIYAVLVEGPTHWYF
jgi:hypothetical protein